MRAVVPKIDLDNVFIAKEEIAQDVQATLTKVRCVGALLSVFVATLHGCVINTGICKRLTTHIALYSFGGDADACVVPLRSPWRRSATRCPSLSVHCFDSGTLSNSSVLQMPIGSTAQFASFFSPAGEAWHAMTYGVSTGEALHIGRIADGTPYLRIVIATHRSSRRW